MVDQVEKVAREQFDWQLGGALTFDSRLDRERNARLEQARHWCELPTIKAALSAYNSNERLREALEEAVAYIREIASGETLIFSKHMKATADALDEALARTSPSGLRE